MLLDRGSGAGRIRGHGIGGLGFSGVGCLVGVLLIATPDGVEIVNLTASVLLTIAFVPYGIQMIRREPREVATNGARG